MYTEKVMEHFKKPKHVGEMKDADAIGEIGNMKCGDVMKLFIKVKDDKIIDIKFLTYGCVAAIASSDMICDLALGKTLDEAMNIKFKDIINDLGELPTQKIHCSVLGTEALQKAIKNYREKQKEK